MSDDETVLYIMLALYSCVWSLLLWVCIRNDGKDPVCTGLLDGFSLGLRQWRRRHD